MTLGCNKQQFKDLKFNVWDSSSYNGHSYQQHQQQQQQQHSTQHTIHNTQQKNHHHHHHHQSPIIGLGGMVVS